MKSIIISGPQGSGKTHIAGAIKLTCSRVFEWRQAAQVINNKNIRPFLDKNPVNYTAVFIDECTLEQITAIDTELNKSPYAHLYPTVVYLTQDNVSNKRPGFQDFYIINCGNNINAF